MDRETADEIRRNLDVVAEGLRSEIGRSRAGLSAELGTEIASLRADIRDLRRHSDVVADSLRSEIRLVAKGVVRLDETFTRELLRSREYLREQFAEMKSLLRASYGDLDRRVQALERKPS